MSEYSDAESSVQGGRPIEIYTWALSGRTFYLTTHDVDVTRGGITYTAITMSRGNITAAPKGRELVVTVPVDSDIALALFNGGIPPQLATLEIRRYHTVPVTLGGSQLFWSGVFASMETDDQWARLKTTGSTDGMFRIRLPVMTMKRECGHKLYDVGCTMNENDFRVATTVVNTSGDGMTIASAGGKPDGWFKQGKVRRVIDGQERTVLEHAATSLQLDVPFPGIANGEAIEVFAGCDLSAEGANGCIPKFDNIDNFGGSPELPSTNPTSPTGFGTIVQA